MVEVEKLATQNKFDYLLIESTGISEPIPIAQTFTFESEDVTIDLSRFSYIDTMVTVVDAFNFLKDFSSSDYLTTRSLTDQIEFANVIIINKIDLITEEQLKELYAIIQKLNPEVLIIPTNESKVELKNVINTSLFTYKRPCTMGLTRISNKQHYFNSAFTTKSNNTNFKKKNKVCN